MMQTLASAQIAYVVTAVTAATSLPPTATKLVTLQTY